MAIRTNSPLIPIRFTGALPTEALEARIEFPIGMGQQDVWIGEPLMPQMLEAVPLRERKDLVLQAINALGPPNSEEEPFPADPAYEARVEAAMTHHGITHEHATILTVLRDLENPGPETRQLLAAADGGTWEPGEAERGAWMRELGRRLIGR